MEDSLRIVKEKLQELREDWKAGRLSNEVYYQLRAELLQDLDPGERSALDTATPMPISSNFGPSGGIESGLRTQLPEIAGSEIVLGAVLFGQWEIIEELGRGGFGVVYRARDLHLDQTLAVKVLDPSKVAEANLLARFKREVSLARGLSHIRIVGVYDYRQDLDRNLAMLSMELVEGKSVRDLNAYKRVLDRRVPPPVALTIIEQTLEALVEAHRCNVIHRDVTPGNILLELEDLDHLFESPRANLSIKLVDFGIAALTKRTELSNQSRVLGTAAYVAPEILDTTSEEPLTAAADIFSVGAVAYELFTGRLAVGDFERPSQLRAGLPKELDDFQSSLLDSRPASRPTAEEALERCRALRQQIEDEWMRREKIRFVERDVLGAMGSEDEPSLRSILGSLEDDPIVDSSEVVAQAKDWLEARLEQRELAEAKRRQQEEGLRRALEEAKETTAVSGGDDEVLEAIEKLSDFLGDSAATDPQIVEVRKELAERSRELEEQRREQRRIDQERRLRAERLEEAQRHLREAIRDRSSERVKLYLEQSRESSEEGGTPLMAEAEEWLAERKREEEEERTQRRWEAEQERKRKAIETLRKRLELSMASDDETASSQIANELMAELGDSAVSDRDLLQVRRWLQEREGVRRAAKRDEALRQAEEERERREKEKLRQAEENALRSQLVQALKLGVHEEVEGCSEKLEKVLGEEAKEDTDLQAALAWLARRRSSKGWLRWAGALVLLLVFGAAAVSYLVFMGVKDRPGEAAAEIKKTKQVAQIPDGVGRVEIRSNVANDMVLVEGENVGSTPRFLDLSPGSYEIKVLKENCTGQGMTIVVEEGEETRFDFQVDCSP